MELWIRSQDKKCLIKVYDIWIDDTDILEEGYVSIVANSNFSFELGIYKTKERALEILDKIQKYIADSFKENEISQFLGTTGKSKIVYEMPQE